MNEQQPRNNPTGPFVAAGMAIGVVVGAVLGVAFDAIPLGSAIGLGLGGTLGVLLSLRQRQNRNE